MEGLLSFLTGNLRQKGITVNEFCDQVGISRQKFYRYVKEPRRFTDANIKKIKDVLQLKDSETALFDSFISPAQAESSRSDLSDYVPYISGLFSTKPFEELSVNRYNIEYLDHNGVSSLQSPETAAYIMAGLDSESSGTAHDEPVSHEYVFTIYNCTSDMEEISPQNMSLSSQGLLTVACIINILEEILSPRGPVNIKVIHYLSDALRETILNTDAGDKKAMLSNFRLFRDTLPFLSQIQNYRIDLSGTTRHFWTDHSNLCLIEHKYTLSPEEKAAENTAGVPDRTVRHTEYYALAFSDSGECGLCRLGAEEASHIYDFLLIDTKDQINALSEQTPLTSPNQTFYEIEKRHKHALIHPDLCFDDIPKEMWLALYEEARNSDNMEFFEGVFRKLIDPHDQYSFLDFESLVYLAVNTLEQRTESGNRMGKIVICHPEGLEHLVRAGIITDLISEATDYIGSGKSKTPLRFPAPMVKNLLELIRESIVRRQNSLIRDPAQYDWTNYYILHPKSAYPEITYIICRDYGVLPLYSRSKHKNTITNCYMNPSVATLMYDYVLSEMIGKRGRELDSAVLSDEHSIALIDKLILEVEKEIS